MAYKPSRLVNPFFSWFSICHPPHVLLPAESDKFIVDMFQKFDVTDDGYIDSIEWTTSLKASDTHFLAEKCLNKGSFYESALDQEECGLVDTLMHRAETLVSLDLAWFDLFFGSWKLEENCFLVVGSWKRRRKKKKKESIHAFDFSIDTVTFFFCHCTSF
jgi:hypothetical protein